MSFQPTFSLRSVLITLAICAYAGTLTYALPNAQAQEAASADSGDSPPSLDEKIELAEIRLAIRLQEVEVAKAERRLLVPGTDGAFEKLIKTAEQKALAAENEASRMLELKNRGLVYESRVMEAGKNSLEAMFERDHLKGFLAANADKLAVHDARIELLELRAKLAKAKLTQLKRRLKR